MSTRLRRRADVASHHFCIVRIAGPGLRLNEHLRHDDGRVVFRYACKLGLEGIVSKRKDSPYRSAGSGPLGNWAAPPNGGRTELWFRRRLSAVRPRSFGCWTSLIDNLEPRSRPGLFPKCDATTSNDDRPGAQASRPSGSAHCRVQGPYRPPRRTRAADHSTRSTY